MTVNGIIAYAAAMDARPRFHANDGSLDVMTINPQPMAITNARALALSPSLDVEGFALVDHVSQIGDFIDLAGNGTAHAVEIEALMLSLTGADAVAVTGNGVLRFSEKSDQCGAHNNSHPARFAHIDISDATALDFAHRSNKADRPWRRFAQYNIWRSFSGPPQDVPLAVCDARSVSPTDLINADAVFDENGVAVWSFEALIVAHNPAHRWHYYPAMSRDEVLVFKAHDSAPDAPHSIPHVAFNDPTCPADTHPRASIEMRAIAYWY